MQENVIFFKEKFGGSQKSSTFALAKRNDAVCSLKCWSVNPKQIAEFSCKWAQKRTMFDYAERSRETENA